MNKTANIRKLLAAAYCIPYAYLAVWGDGIHGTMIFYGIMVLALGVLCWSTIRRRDFPLLAAGNIVHFTVSWAAVRFTNLKPMGEYFKPFTSVTLIFIIAIAAWLIQLISYQIFTRKK